MDNNTRISILLKERGYIVLRANRPAKIGRIFNIISGCDGGKLPQPFAVIKETDKQDAIEQEDILVKYGKARDNIEDGFYYRLTTD